MKKRSAAFFAGSHQIMGRTFNSYCTTVDDRVRWVAACEDAALLRTALRTTGLQSGVRKAIERRLRVLVPA